MMQMVETPCAYPELWLRTKESPLMLMGEISFAASALS